MSGCAIHGATSFILFGAYFPAWMVCGVFGILAAVLMRVLMVVSGFSDVLPLQLFLCIAIGIIIATAVWLLWLGR